MALAVLRSCWVDLERAPPRAGQLTSCQLANLIGARSESAQPTHLQLFQRVRPARRLHVQSSGRRRGHGRQRPGRDGFSVPRQPCLISSARQDMSVAVDGPFNPHISTGIRKVGPGAVGYTREVSAPS